MYILGDIGNSETKIYLVSSNGKIIKSINISTKKININILKYLISCTYLINKCRYKTNLHAKPVGNKFFFYGCDGLVNVIVF